MTNEELKKLANQNRELQENLQACQVQLEETEERQLVRTRKLREEMRDLHDKHKQQTTALESAHKVRFVGRRTSIVYLRIVQQYSIVIILALCAYLPKRGEGGKWE